MGLGSDNASSKKGGDWALKSEGLRLVRACLQAADELEEWEVNNKSLHRASSHSEKVITSSNMSDDHLTSSSGEPLLEGKAAAPPPPVSTATKVNVYHAMRKRLAILFPHKQCLAAATDARLAVPIRSLLLDLVRLQIFSEPSQPTSPSAATTTRT